MTSKYDIFGECINLLIWLTTNEIFGLITIKYINVPTSLWKVAYIFQGLIVIGVELYIRVNWG
jgi:hypothetical protein